MRIRRHLLSLLLLLPAAPAFGFGIGIHPTTVEVGLEPGSHHRQVLTVGNVHREKPLALTVGLADWSLDEHQQLQLYPPGSTTKSAAGWVRFSPASLKLDPGESQRVLVEIDVPVEVGGPGDYRVAVLVSPVLPPPEERRRSPSGVWSRVQVSSLFYVGVPPAAAEPVVVGADAGAGPSGTPEVRFEVENRGNAHARISGQLRLVDGEGRVRLRQPVERVVLEGQVGEVRAPLHEGWRQLPGGRYRVEFGLESYEGRVAVELSSPPVLTLPLPEPPPDAGAEPSS